MTQAGDNKGYDEAVFARFGKANPFRRATASVEQSPEVAEMRQNRRVNQKIANTSGRQGSDIQFATGRPRDPMFYWKQNNLPYDTSKDDELKKIRNFCNTPDAPVWMGDYSFKPMGEIVVGDEVIGWEYRSGPMGQQRKVLVRTPVLAIQRRMAPEVVKVTLESGEVIRCTPDHLWANPHFSPGQQSGNRGWQQPEYRAAKVGQELIRVITPTSALASEKERLVAAWLGGVYDGEGCGEGIGQSQSHNPAVCDRIKESLDFLGLPWTANDAVIFLRQPGRRQGFAQDMVDFLNWTDPVRRTSAAIDKRLLATPNGGREKVISIESEGSGEVISMQTGTGNYTAWGLASKNCRLLYMTHPLIGSCVDIYSKYPLLGMELTCKDEQLTDFYNTHFFDEEGLNYKEFLIDIGREYWTVGEAWPFGSFNEMLGVWEDDELLNPDDVDVQRSPFQKEPRFLIKLPQTLRDLISTQSPRWEYQKLMENYPELQHYAGENDQMPVSNILLRQMKFKGDTFNKRGVPILMRGLRSIVQEEMLNAAMDSIADRLYTPLILVKLGASATDLGTDMPWIPTSDDLADFEESLDAALAADFRAIVHHFGVTMEPVFGRENMPNMDNDFERIEERMLQVFGLSKTMLSGASGGQTYAADALNRDLISQLLTTYQTLVKNHYKQRAMVVAEAQEHYDYDVRNGKRYVKMEEILEVDEETGEERIVEQPKLLIPDMQMKTMNLSDENAERAFIEQLVAAGVPISIKTRLVNVPIEFEDEVETSRDEAIARAVAEQETRKGIYQALKAQGLPIPDDLRQDFDPKAVQAQDSATEGQRAPMMGLDPTVDTPNLAPTMQDLEADQAPGEVMPGMQTQQVDPNAPQMAAVIPFGQPGAQGAVPPESNEMRAGMPKPASLHRQASRMREVVAAHYESPMSTDEAVEDKFPIGKFGTPKHVGMRRYAKIDKDTPMEEWGKPA